MDPSFQESLSPIPNISYVKGGCIGDYIKETTIGIIKGDARNLGYGSDGPIPLGVLWPSFFRAPTMGYIVLRKHMLGIS